MGWATPASETYSQSSPAQRSERSKVKVGMVIGRRSEGQKGKKGQRLKLERSERSKVKVTNVISERSEGQKGQKGPRSKVKVRMVIGQRSSPAQRSERSKVKVGKVRKFKGQMSKLERSKFRKVIGPRSNL